ncbi:MAG: N-acetylmuramoyl-L-alanine amidase [Cytophagales bacterium]|nr:N-acetylmuramoyl-L-alanine amidase [Cytophagales bacterium]
MSIITINSFNKVKKTFVTSLLCSIFVLSSFTPLEIQNYQLKTVIIDAGHGGKDPGCLGKHLEEADVALGIALELGRKIKKYYPSINVIYTRSADKFVELHERAAIANKKNGDLFISIHCNSGPSKAFGTETYAMGLHTSTENLEVAERENSVVLKEDNYEANYDGYDPNSPISHIMLANSVNQHLENSLLFADKIQKRFKNVAKRKSRGVKQAGFVVLWKTAMPSVLIETGFLTNSQEEQYLGKKVNQQKIAASIFEAFKEYRTYIEE